MSDDTPVLETPRLVLRLPRIEDFDAYAEYMSDAESARFIGGVMSRPVAWRSFLQLAGAWQLQGFSMFSVISKADGAWIGRVGPWMPDGWPGTEVGWGIVLAQCNRGYATEAATAAMDWAFDTLGWAEVIHTIAPGNEASRAVARKLGARRPRCRNLGTDESAMAPTQSTVSNLGTDLITPFGRGRGGPGSWWIIFETNLRGHRAYTGTGGGVKGRASGYAASVSISPGRLLSTSF